jgi:acyl-coenzyme A synthetase/AMP-(fatty) acid ligase
VRRPEAVAVVPLIAHAAPQEILAYRRGEPLTAARFLADVARVAAMLPSTRHVLNACQDRYHFAVGLAAAIVSDRISLLPSTHTPEVIRQLRRFAADAICLTDEDDCSIDLPQASVHGGCAPRAEGFRVPLIAADALVAYVFTSGSTGLPVPHPKTWGRLADAVTVEAIRLGLGASRRATIVATVPPQHMYGFESSVLLPLQSGHALCAERPFFPADIASALEAVPAPRILVSTPVHLRALLAAESPLPELALIVSATAPLALDLARQVEARFGAPLLEIYGSTETGQMASRRTTAAEDWQLFPGVRIDIEGEHTWVHGGHVETRTPMGDVLEVTGEDRFQLRGRTGDLVNIAGKRSSIGYLNHQLTSIPGVVDGVFVVQDEDPDSGVARLAALVVAPTLDAVTITQALRDRLDPVFLPRPLLFVAEIARNATGKIPKHALETLLRGR